MADHEVIQRHRTQQVHPSCNGVSIAFALVLLYWAVVTAPSVIVPGFAIVVVTWGWRRQPR